MFSKVFSFGCSYSCWRQDFHTGFVDIIAKTYNCPLENWSSPGNSNEEIIFGFNKKFFGNEIFDSLILFQTTHTIRTAYWEKRLKDLVSVKLTSNTLDEEEYTFLQTNDVLKTGDGSFIFEEDQKDYFEQYFSKFYDESYEYKKLVYNLHHIQSSAINKNNKIIFLYFDNIISDFHLLHGLNLFKPDGSLSSLEWSLSNKHTYSENDFHLSENGNKVYAEKLIEFINKDQSKE